MVEEEEAMLLNESLEGKNSSGVALCCEVEATER